ncbi:MAG: hypothetical protein KatS3mg084_0363 [Candidatus Dojkabacteria bacterium]|nr:MAG: hypothetical protein KatS3mg084_0363 [Candidatus Dojkabacteria bacterium]
MIEKVLGRLPVRFVDNDRFVYNDRYEKTIKVLRGEGFISEDGHFVDGGKSWEIIGPDTPIDGRVYPAIVGGSVLVDYEGSKRLQRLYGLMCNKLGNKGQSKGDINSRRMAVLEEVFYTILYY